ncbi:hypothetical protein Atu4328 [Agrobacterium fabrum str. C58]|uniref:Uncharacterized protein n=1 Tax=Agrobacterium fabrum (strain C58 / ATCC 33970) TaxID=176299 RepID=Q8U7X1_AGRFC|nr:hypothetical protein Atu4328 [Agrobacterium fabrum str. C58]
MPPAETVAAGALASSITGIFSLVRGKVADRILPAVGPSDGFAQALKRAISKTVPNFFIPHPLDDST